MEDWLELEAEEGERPAVWGNLANFYFSEERCLKPPPWDRKILLAPADQVGEMTTRILDPIGQFLHDEPGGQKNLFDYLLNRKPDRSTRILLSGEAGFGKTTFCSNMAHDWINNGHFYRGFPCANTLLVYYKLRNLRRGKNLEEELMNYVEGKFFSEDSDIGNVRKTLKQYGSKVILLLDGYNETTADHQEQVLELLKGNGKTDFQRASIVLTTRPIDDRHFLVLFDRHYILNGLSDEGMETTVRKYYMNTDSDVRFILSKFGEVLQLYKKPPLLLTVLCYLQRMYRASRIDTIEKALYYCVREICRREAYNRGTLFENKEIEKNLHGLGKCFVSCLNERIFRFTKEELLQYLPLEFNFFSVSGLFRNVFTGKKVEDEMEVIHPSFMEILATYYVEEHWYSLLNSQTSVYQFPSVHSVELFAYSGGSGKPNFKVIGENRNLGYFVWDLVDGSCVLSSYLNKSHVPREMGECKLNISFLIHIPNTAARMNVLSLLNHFFPDNEDLQTFPNFVPTTEAKTITIHFLVNKEQMLCPALSQLHQPELCVASPWRILRNLAAEITLTFFRTGCNHRYIVQVAGNLMEIDLQSEKETKTSTDLLNVLKNYDPTSEGYICGLAAVASTGKFYYIDTKRRKALEDFTMWFPMSILRHNNPSSYPWNSIDLFVLTYQREL